VHWGLGFISRLRQRFFSDPQHPALHWGSPSLLSSYGPRMRNRDMATHLDPEALTRYRVCLQDFMATKFNKTFFGRSPSPSSDF
jgi:hypothetical protein